MREDWEIVQLGNLADYYNGRAFKPSEWKSKGKGIIRIQNLNNPKAPFNYTENLYEERYKIKKGDLLYAWSASLGVYIWKGEDAWLNQHIFKVVEKPLTVKLYLFYLLDKITGELYSKAHGSGMVHVTKGKFDSTLVPLPPLPEQRAIVKKLETLFSSLDAGVADLKKAQQQLKIYRQAVLKKAFEGELTNKVRKNGIQEGWKIVKIVDIVDKDKNALKAGPFGSSLKKEFYTSEGYKIYGQEQVINNNPYFGNYYVDEQKYNELYSCRVKPNDILISLVGTVGKVLLLPNDCAPGIINPRLVKITLDLEKYLPLFFKYYFESAFVKSFYSGETRGTTMDVLNLGIIKTIPFPLTHLDEQKEVIKQIESRLSVCDAIEQNIAASLEKAEALRQSILKKAFEGNLLTAQELAECKLAEDYEPASVLLEKIKAEQKQAIKPKKKLKTKPFRQ